MTSALLALVICTLLALSFPSTRGIGILGTAILILFYPVATTVALLFGGTATLIILQRKKGTS
jgi:hypothetical protein